MDDQPNKPVVQSYVWHDEKCFYVSTIERDSSSPYNPGRYNETMVWLYDHEKRERVGDYLFIGSDSAGSLYLHNKVLGQIHHRGTCDHDVCEPDEP